MICHGHIAFAGTTCYNRLMSPIRVLLVDDHALLRQGTRELLEHERDIEIITEADDGQQAVQLAAELQTDVVVMEAAMDVMNGVEAARQIKAHCPDTAVLILSAYDSDAFVFASLEAGATGYLLKSYRADELAQAVRTVHAGGSRCTRTSPASWWIISLKARTRLLKPNRGRWNKRSLPSASWRCSG